MTSKKLVEVLLQTSTILSELKRTAHRLADKRRRQPRRNVHARQRRHGARLLAHRERQLAQYERHQHAEVDLRERRDRHADDDVDEAPVGQQIEVELVDQPARAALAQRAQL